MNFKLLASWGIALAALAAGWFGYGWRGVVLAFTVIVFWLLLQFSRALRALRKASGAPVGHVDSAVMLHSKLRADMTLAQVLVLTGSLGEQLQSSDSGTEESWRWRDPGGAHVNIRLRSGRVLDWTLSRTEADR